MYTGVKTLDKAYKICYLWVFLVELVFFITFLHR